MPSGDARNLPLSEGGLVVNIAIAQVLLSLLIKCVMFYDFFLMLVPSQLIKLFDL